MHTLHASVLSSKKVRLNENHSTQKNIFSKFWWIGTRSFFKRQFRLLTLAASLYWSEYLRYHEDKVPPMRSAFNFDPFVKIFEFYLGECAKFGRE